MKSDHIAKENVARINKAIYYIDTHLDQKLLLQDIAEKAHFSPYHFHRLFSVVMKETPNEYIVRKRIEKAASFFLNKKNISVTEASERTGFSSISSFSRAFKKFYGLAPQEFKEQGPEKFSKIRKIESKNGQTEVTFEQYIRSIQQSLNWIQMNATTEIKTVGDFELAYVSHVGKMDNIGHAFDTLIRWAAPKGLMGQENLRMVTIYHDSPKITDPNHLRMSACMILNENVKVEGEIGLRILETTKCIVSRFEIAPFEFQQAWESNFVWMTENGYKKADKDPFEIYYNNYLDHPQRKFIVDLCIPIQ
jgi:AraC family transcriptional regulator